MSFSALGLIEPLQRAVAELGYSAPTPVQAQVIPAVIEGRDVIAAAQTGTGKTAGFALPMLQRLVADARATMANAPRALVLAPTRELAEQVRASFLAYGRYLPVRVEAMYGGVAIEPQLAALGEGVDIVVATPGRLLDLHRQEVLGFGQLRTLVLDEADRMLELGFARELDAIFAALPKRRQTLLFSATYSDPIRAIATRLLRQPLNVEIGRRNAAAQQVKHWLVPVDKKRKPDLFRHLLKTKRWRQALVFVKTRKGVEQLVASLQAIGVAAESIHGDKPQPARLRALDRFKNGEVRILVATDVAARGLDIDDLPLVVNFDLPIVPEDYIHRIGRTGRAGASGEAVSLVCADEVDLLAAIEVLLKRTLPRIECDGFEPDHRVPLTGAAAKKPAAAKSAAKPATGRAAARPGQPPARAKPRPASGPRGQAPRKRR